MLPLLTEQTFSTLKRDPLLDYDAYQAEAQDLLNRIPKAAKRLGDPDWLKDKDCGTLLRMTCARAEYALDLLALSYSAGVSVQLLRDFFPQVLEYFEEYALYSEAFNDTPEGMRNPGPHIAICDVEFRQANRLLCFAILLGHQRTIPNIMALVNYCNPKRDGMLERLAACYTERPQPMPSSCTRKSPYGQTLAIFTAPREERAGRIRDYLGKWYEASSNEPYYGTHDGRRFLGYWSWEAAAITIALDIDDHSYRDSQFYPSDLSEFARQTACGSR